MTGLSRITVAGKFFRAGDDRFFAKAVSYGPFPPDAEGRTFPIEEALQRDLQMVVELGANTLRVYEVPSVEFVDACAGLGLRVIIGIPWAQHVDFLEDEGVLVEARESLCPRSRLFVGIREYWPFWWEMKFRRRLSGGWGRRK